MSALDVKAFGIMLGCIWAVAVWALGLVAMTTNYGAKIVQLFATVYIGYKPTLAGSFIGAFWGFIDGGITGVLIAWLYNRFIS